MHIAYYRSGHIARFKRLPGIAKFYSFFEIYRDDQIAPVDRSGVFKVPIKVKSFFPLPQMRVFTKTYEQICNERAKDLLKRAERLDVPLYIFWSGGVDSTCLLVSLLKVANSVQKERLVILMSENSINEYPLFYRKYIRGKLRRESANMFPYILGTKNLLISGECNDQLFGSDILGRIGRVFGENAICEPYDRKLFTEYLDANPEFVDLFERLAAAAPVPLKTNFDRCWWMNFVVKWQTVYMRTLSFVAKSNAEMISQQYVDDYYVCFFNTEDFQLWSMNNLDLRIRATWRSYKWPAKEIIYRFTKDSDYRDNKLKHGSLAHLIGGHVAFNFIDENFKFHENVSPEEFYEPDNDFL